MQSFQPQYMNGLHVQETADIRRYWDVVKRRRIHFLVPALIAFTLSVIIAFVLPPVYKSSGTILIEAQEIPREFVTSTVTGYVEERLQIITQLVLSRTKLLEIIKRFNLYDDLAGRYTTEEIIEKMREDITMKPIQAEVVSPDSRRPGTATIAFTLSYEGKDPAKVTQVANVLTSLYLEENLKNREEKAQGTFDFLETQLAELRREIVDAEKKIAEFKNQHISQLPELMQLNLQTMERLEREIDAKREQIKSLTNRKIYLEGQLATIDPMTYMVSPDGKRLMSPEDEVKFLKNEYLKLSATLSQTHPDVISLKKRLEALGKEEATPDDLQERQRQLKEKKTQLALLEEQFSSQHPDVVKAQKELMQLKAHVEALSKEESVLEPKNQVPTNPSYISLQTQIASTDMEIESAKEEVGLLTKKYERYQRRVETTPQVEQQYRALQRDYANAQAKYQETTNRLLAAREAKGLEESQMGERFTLIDPPVMPEKPDSPNRLAIAIVGLVLAIGTGMGFGAVAECTDQSVRRVDELARITGYPVLGAIPLIRTKEDRSRKRRRKLAWAGTAAGLLFVGLMGL
ncbi:MAG TPA: lipopolysaccharide biosynthesis protein, partial [Desulfobacterales bacterium]|nr:lipopolysaccharide biosynthesis protein [Desulfobacterales bacterium]